MKISKWEFAILILLAVFLACTVGWFLRGKDLAAALAVETERRPDMPVIRLTEPGPSPEPEGDGAKININTADAETLMTLPGIGEKRAKDIIAEREENGPYRFPEDITRVSGIGEETLAKLIDHIITEDEP